MLPQTDKVKEVVAALEAEEPAARFSVPVPPSIRWRLVVYRLSLQIQRLFRRASAKRGVIEKRLDCVNTLQAERT